MFKILLLGRLRNAEERSLRSVIDSPNLRSYPQNVVLACKCVSGHRRQRPIVRERKLGFRTESAACATCYRRDKAALQFLIRSA
jgi:hypothetical protein